MTLKEQIQQDFIVALKAKDETSKSALSSLKAKINEAEKLNGTELFEQDILKVLNKAIKQREESISLFTKGGRTELVQKENEERLVLIKYLPVQMTEDEIETAVKEIITTLPNIANINALMGKTIGEFNKKHQGKADSKLVISAIEKLIKV